MTALAERLDTDPAASDAPREREPWWARPVGPVALVVTLGALITWRASFVVDGRRTFTLFDDAMVSMRYAENLANGDGLVFNPGGEAVEGYTNLLWTLWMALIHLLPAPAAIVPAVVSMSGAALVGVAVVLAGRVSRRLGAGALTAAVTMWMVAVWFPLLWWSVRGMEPGLLAALLTGAVLLALRLDGEPDARTELLLVGVVALGLLTRTDFVVFVAVLVLWLGRRPGPARATGGRVALAAVAVLALHTVLRWAVYGEVVPNTFALKLGGIPLDARLNRGALTLASVVAASTALLLFLAAVAVWRRRAGTVLLAAMWLGAAAYTLVVGGDAWEYNQFDDRYLAPAAPLLLVLAALGAREVVRSSRLAVVVLAVPVAALLAGTQIPADDRLIRFAPYREDLLRFESLAVVAFAAIALGAWLVVRRHGSPSVAGALVALAALVVAVLPAWLLYLDRGGDLVALNQREASLGAALGDIARPGATIAVAAAGNVPYWSGVESVDVLGKSDPVIARMDPRPVAFVPGHNKWDYEYSVCELRPDVVVQLWEPTARDRALIEDCGYRNLVGNVYEREGQRGFDAGELREVIWTR